MRTRKPGESRTRGLDLPEQMIEELAAEAKRQERTTSWLLQKAWVIARPTMAKLGTAK